MKQITDFGQLTVGDVVKMQSNGMDTTTEVASIEFSSYKGRQVAMLDADEATFVVSETEDHPLQSDNGLFYVGGCPKAKLFQV